jgi:hypothetical protein
MFKTFLTHIGVHHTGGNTEGAHKEMGAIPYFLLIADYEKAFLCVVCSLEIASLRNG